MLDFPRVRRVLVGMRDLFAHDHDDIATHACKVDGALRTRLITDLARFEASDPRHSPFCLASALRCPWVTKALFG